jgi:predicted permease
MLRLLPVVVGIGAGILLRRLAAVDRSAGELVFRLVFYVCIPALMFRSLATVTITGELLVFLLTPPVVVALGYLLAVPVAHRMGLNPRQAAVFVVASMMINSGFMLPFIQALYGAEGVARVAAFDAVNTVLTFTWAYHRAARGNPEHQGESMLVSRVLRSPPLYGIAAGLAVNLSGLPVPAAVGDVASTFGSATALLIPLGIGILFTPVPEDLSRAARVVAVRLVAGLVVGVGVIALFGLGGMDRTIMLLLSVAPVAFVTVTFATLENLDTRLATAALSLSLATSTALALAISFTAS